MPPTKDKPITLADLGAEDRKALLEEAREESRHNPTDVDGYADLSETEQAIRRAMDARDHTRGCPVQTGQSLGRVEGYDARRPANPALGEPARMVGVVRCIECAGATVFDGKGERPLLTLDEAIDRHRAPSPMGPSSDDEPETDSDL